MIRTKPISDEIVRSIQNNESVWVAANSDVDSGLDKREQQPGRAASRGRRTEGGGRRDDRPEGGGRRDDRSPISSALSPPPFAILVGRYHRGGVLGA
jgi:hypothetical protein